MNTLWWQLPWHVAPNGHLSGCPSLSGGLTAHIKLLFGSVLTLVVFDIQLCCLEDASAACVILLVQRDLV